MSSIFSRIVNITSNEATLCGVCEEQIDEKDEDVFVCDVCDETIHMTCGNSNKTQIKARKNSKCLKIYCPKYMDADVLPGRVNELIQ